MKEKYLGFLSEYLYRTFLNLPYQWSDSQKDTLQFVTRKINYGKTP